MNENSSAVDLFVLRLTQRGYKDVDYNHALSHQKWGFKRALYRETMSPEPGDIILFCSECVFDSNSPGRSVEHELDNAELGNVVLATVTTPVETPQDGDLFWPSEKNEDQVIYKDRFDFEVFGQCFDVRVADAPILGEYLRKSGISGSRPYKVFANDNDLE